MVILLATKLHSRRLHPAFRPTGAGAFDPPAGGLRNNLHGFSSFEKNCDEKQETKAAGLWSLVVKILPPRKGPENKNIFFLLF